MTERLQAKIDKQRHEIARLTRALEMARADKSRLLYDLNRERARADMLAERLKS